MYDRKFKILGFSILTIIFAENREKYLGYGETAAGIGLAIGPVIGSSIYSISGYLECFILFTILLFLNGLFCLYILPKSLNQK